MRPHQSDSPNSTPHASIDAWGVVRGLRRAARSASRSAARSASRSASRNADRSAPTRPHPASRLPYTNAAWPVIARPTMSVFTSRVPSYE